MGLELREVLVVVISVLFLAYLGLPTILETLEDIRKMNGNNKS